MTAQSTVAAVIRSQDDQTLFELYEALHNVTLGYLAAKPHLLEITLKIDNAVFQERAGQLGETLVTEIEGDTTA